DIGISFPELYCNRVITNEEQIRQIIANKERYSHNITVGIFTGISGKGHLQPAEVLADEFVNKGYNVVLIDPIYIKSEARALFNNCMWSNIARHFPIAWKLVRYLVSKEPISDIIFKSTKDLYSSSIEELFETLNIKIAVSTFTYTTAMLFGVEIPSVNSIGIVSPDLSPIGFLNNPYHKNESSGKEVYSYFLKDELSWSTGLSCYKKALQEVNYEKQVVIMEGMFNFLEKNPPKPESINIGRLYANLGSASGIGDGGKYIETILESFKGKIILNCGDNKAWKQKAEEIIDRTNSCDVIITGCLPESIHEKLVRTSVYIAKAGGSQTEEVQWHPFSALFTYIPGQEAENYKHAIEKGYTCDATTHELLKRFLENPQETKIPKTQNTATIASKVVEKLAK
ncbi:MAG: hypothetical protein RSD14_03890, partial [Clostridia bacterium]